MELVLQEMEGFATCGYHSSGILHPPHPRVIPQSGDEMDEKQARRSAKLRSRRSEYFERQRARCKKGKKSAQLEEVRRQMKKYSKDVNRPQEVVSDDVKKQMELMCQGLNPESGVDFSNVTKVLNHLENFVAMCYTVSGMNDPARAASTLFLYVKTISSESVSASLWQYLCNILMEKEESIVPFEDGYLAESGVEYLDVLRNLSKNFSLLTANPVFPKISYLLSACVCAGLCEASSLTWSVGSVNLFKPDVYMKHIRAESLIDAVISTVLYFVEGGHEYFINGTMGGFLFSDSRIERLQESYNKLCACQTHFKTGMLRKETGMSNHEYASQVDETIEGLKKVSRLVTGGEKASIDRMLTKMYEIRMEFNATRVRGGLRCAPYCTFYRGTSGVGKSVLTGVMPSIIGALNNFDASPDKCTTLNPDDQYHSGMRGDVTVVTLDDIFNTHKDFLMNSPCVDVITFVNNIVCYAIMADVESKGKIPIEPKLVQITSNLPDMGAYTASNHPAAILRRAIVTVDVRVKPQFRKTGGNSLDMDKVKLHYQSQGLDLPILPDVWELDVWEPIPVPSPTHGAREEIEYRPHRDEKGPLIKVDVHRYVEFIKVHSRKWYADQEDLVERSNVIHQSVKLCEKCDKINFMCQCQPCIMQDVIEAESGVMPLASPGTIDTESLIRNLNCGMLNLLSWFPDAFVGKVTKFLLRWKYSEDLFMIPTTPDIMWTFWRLVLVSFLTIPFNMCILQLHGFYWNIFGLFHFVFFMCGLPIIYYLAQCLMDQINITKLSYRRRCTQAAMRPDALIVIGRNQRKRITDAFIAGSLAMAAIYAVVKSGAMLRRLMSHVAHGSLQPVSEDDVRRRDKEVCNYQKVVPSQLPNKNRQLVTCTMDQFVNTISDNLYYMRIKGVSEERYRVCNILFLRASVFLMPYHVLFSGADPVNGKTGDLDFTVHKLGTTHGPTTSVGKLSECSWVRIPDTDLVVVNADVAGTMSDITHVFTENDCDGPAEFLYRNDDGTLRREVTTLSKGRVGHKFCQFDGASYKLEGGTKPGLCMGLLMSQRKEKSIVGFHLGGKNPIFGITSTFGICGGLKKSQLEEAIAKLSSERLLPHSKGEFPTEMYGMKTITTYNIDKHSPVQYLTESRAFHVYGTCSGGVTATSKVVQSLISDTVEKYMACPQKWGPPKLKPSWMPWRENLVNIVTPSTGFKPRVVKWAVDDYCRRIITHIKENDYARSMFGVLTMEQAINGIPGVRFIDKINANTSVGYPLAGPKSNMMIELEPNDVYPNPVDFNEDVQKEIRRIEMCYEDEERAFPIYKACLKDEPTPIVKDKAPRVMYATQVARGVHARKYLLSVTRFINTHPLMCESMVGINCMSPEWKEFRDFITKNGRLDHRTFAIDYSKYDQKIPPQLITAAYECILRLCEASGKYSPYDMRQIRGIFSDAVYPMVAYNGTLMSFANGAMSGDSITVYINNLVNSILQRCAFYELEVLKTREREFRDAIHAGNYGDDNKGCVEEDVEFYNMQSYQRYMAEHGIKVTMPDKTVDMVKFMHWDEADFLKRKDSFIPEINMHLGKLDEDSIFKSLHSNLRNANLSREELAIACMTGAAHEWFAHGREVYETRIGQLKEVAREHHLDVKALDYSFDDRVNMWQMAHCEGPMTHDQMVLHDQKIRDQDSLFPFEEFAPESGQPYPCIGYPLCGQRGLLGFYIYGGRNHDCYQNSSIMCALSRAYMYFRLGICINFLRGRSLTLHERNQGVDAPTVGTDLEYSQSSDYVSSLSNSDIDITYLGYDPESGEESFDIHTQQNLTTHTATTFSSMNPGYVYDIKPSTDITFNNAVNEVEDIQHFFKRPTLLDNMTWTPGAVLYRTFQPWALFLAQPRIANRLSNYRNVKGTMHLRFLINGNPFYYGLAIAHAVPVPTALDEFGSYRNPFDPNVVCDMVGCSQTPHVYLDPTLSQGGDLVLPFMFQYNAMNIVTGDQTLLWDVYVRQFSNLAHALNNTDPVNIAVMAWVEDLEMSGLTNHNIAGISPQSGDEYGTTAVSDMATAVAKTSGMLKNAPVIGKYARASEMVASHVASVAKAFGYSRPALADNIHQLTPSLFGNMANANVSDGVMKLTMDVKQETTIDPSTVSAAGDDMDLVALAKRESYIATFSWPIQAAHGSDICHARVCPSMYVQGPGAQYPELHLTPAAWVCVPFSYWRGTMKFRFKVLASNFHKGRLRISYDPVYSENVSSFNSVHNYIVDISESKDFTVHIGWASNKPYLECGTLSEIMYSPVTIASTNLIENGTIKIEVFNKLTAPDVSSDQVTILMFASMCDDFEVFGPRSVIMSSMTYNNPNDAMAMADEVDPQSGVEQLDEKTDEPSRPVIDAPDTTLGAGMLTDPSIMICAGESIISWRQVLKRYCFHNAGQIINGATATTTSYIGRWLRPDFPLYRGYQSDGVHTTSTGAKYNYVQTTILNWVVPAYLGWRGGIRWKYAVVGGYGVTQGMLALNRVPFNPGWTGDEGVLTSAGNTNSSVASAYFTYYPSFWQGGTATELRNNPVVNAEMPYQYNSRFFSARRKNMAVANTSFRAHQVVLVSQALKPVVAAHVAAGDDFTTFMFISVPRCWFRTGNPTPQ